jgi:hypothetical protein
MSSRVFPQTLIAVDYFAHSLEGKPVDELHRLEEHEGTVPDLRTARSRVVESGLSTAKKNVANFAAEFGFGKWGYLVGLWHRGIYSNRTRSHYVRKGV